jgi:hypothetical protein
MNQPLLEYKVLYRGQQMHLDELKSIEAKLGNLIGMTTFWPATPSSGIAYLTAITPVLDMVLSEPAVFIINTSLHFHRSTFVDISQLSSYRRPQEIIFPPRSLFRVEMVKKLRDIWYIDLTLVDESDDQFIQLVHFWKTSIGLRNFFSLLAKKKYFLRIFRKKMLPFFDFNCLLT